MKRFILISLLYISLYQWVTGLPLLIYFDELISTRGFMSKGGDLGGTVWLYSLPSETFLPWGSFLFTHRVSYPFGERITAVTPNFLDALLFSPFSLIGFPGGYNLFILLIFYTNFIFTFFLFRKVIKEWVERGREGGGLLAREPIREVIPFLGGCIFSFSPVISGEINHGRPTNTILFLIPLSLLFLEKGIRNGRLYPLIICGILSGLSGWIYIFYTPCHSIIIISFVLYLLLLGGRLNLKRALLPILVPLMISSILIALYYSTIREEARSSIGGPPLLLPGAIVPTPWLTRDHIMINESMDILFPFKEPLPFYDDFRGGTIPLLTIIPLLLSLPLIRINLPLLSATLLFYLLSLGPYLKTGGEPGPESSLIPLPFFLILKTIPAFSRFHHISRFLLFFNFLVPSLLLTSPRLFPLPLPSPLKWGFPLLVLLLLLTGMTDLPPSCRLSTIPLPSRDIVRSMESLPSPLLHLPMGTEREHLFFQSIHKRYLVNGIDDRRGLDSDSPYARYYSGNRFLTCLRRAGGAGPPPAECSFKPGEAGLAGGVILSLNTLKTRFPSDWRERASLIHRLLMEGGFEETAGDRWIRLYSRGGWRRSEEPANTP